MAFSFRNHPLYLYPSEFNVRDFVLEKLSDSNYEEWKKLMLDFIESPGLVGFIDGMVGAPPSAPPEMATVPVPNAGGGGGASSSSRCHQIIENEEKYRSWKRSDGLVRVSILTTLTKDILTRVLPFKTAEEVWTELEAMFHAATRIPTFDEKTQKFFLACQPLQIAAIKGDWESAMKFIEELPHAARVPITPFSETALIIAVSMIRRNHFVKKLF